MTLRKIWKNYNLSVVLALLFLVSWAGQAVFQWFEFVDEAHAHGQTAHASAYLNAFLQATFENWQSEFLQLLSFVILTSFLIHRGSHESKDEDEKMERKLAEISRKLDKLVEGSEKRARVS